MKIKTSFTIALVVSTLGAYSGWASELTGEANPGSENSWQASSPENISAQFGSTETESVEGFGPVGGGHGPGPGPHPGPGPAPGPHPGPGPVYPGPHPGPGPVYPGPHPGPGPVYPGPHPGPGPVYPGPHPGPGPVYPGPHYPYPGPHPGPGFPGHMHDPYPVHGGYYPWPHWGHPVFERPIYDWNWASVQLVTCTSEDSNGDFFPVTEDGFRGWDYQQQIVNIEDASLDRCYSETNGDQGCTLVDCTPGY